jgi:hypothetical protein
VYDASREYRCTPEEYDGGCCYSYTPNVHRCRCRHEYTNYNALTKQLDRNGVESRVYYAMIRERIEELLDEATGDSPEWLDSTGDRR